MIVLSNPLLLQDHFDNKLHFAVKAGHRKIAAHLIERAFQSGGHGFNHLHHEVGSKLNLSVISYNCGLCNSVQHTSYTLNRLHKRKDKELGNINCVLHQKFIPPEFIFHLFYILLSRACTHV